MRENYNEMKKLDTEDTVSLLLQKLESRNLEVIQLQDRLIAYKQEKADAEDALYEANKLADELRNQVAELEKKVEEHWQEIQAYSNLVAYERGETEKLQAAYLAMSQSSCWRITKPVRVILDLLKRMLRLAKKGLVFLCRNGVRSTLQKAKRHMASVPVPASTFAHNAITQNPIDPIQTVLIDAPVKRLNLVTDTIGAESLLGGVATALIVATEFANRNGYELRIITRNAEINPLNYEKIIRISGIRPAEKVSFYSDYDRFDRTVDFKLEVSPQDIFFATSWWSAMAIADTTIRKRFFYIIQEVETFFYNYGGERLLCEQVMKNENIDFIINSGYLNQYFKEHEPQIAARGCYFEPAFPKTLYNGKSFAPKTKYKLFFYARPNNPRNLYSVGVEMLKKAVDKGILDTEEWEIYCVGQNCPVITFANGSQTINLGQLSWTEYAKFLSEVDLGLCLMYTPHPSYPPFDVASSGGVVLTNKMLNKTSFDMCKNVILADLDETSFMNAFEDAVRLAKDMKQRKQNYEERTIPGDWAVTLEETIAYMKERAESV